MACLVVTGRLLYFSFSNNLLLTGHECKEQDAPYVPVTAVGFSGLRQGPGGGGGGEGGGGEGAGLVKGGFCHD